MGKAQPGKTLGVFIHLAGDFVPAGLLTLLEQHGEPLASRFSYGLRYLERHNAAASDAPQQATARRFGAVSGRNPDPIGRNRLEKAANQRKLPASQNRHGACFVLPSTVFIPSTPTGRW